MTVVPARRSARTHAAILDAAVAVAAEAGYLGAGIEAIAAVAGAGKQTIYRWWPNKAALFIEAYGRLVPPEALQADTGSLRGDLLVLLERLGELYRTTPAGGILAGLLAEAQADPALARQLHDHYVAPRRAIVGALLRRAERRGELRPGVDAALTSDLLGGAVWFRLLLRQGPLDRAAAAAIVEHLLKGLLP